MEKYRPYPETAKKERLLIPEPVYQASWSQREKEFLAAFTPEQQDEIGRKLQILSSLAYFIGKDLKMPVELNEPGAGWHWDFKKNVVRVDPQSLLERPIDELRYLMCHEGGHRRVSRMEFIPLEEWRQPGFSAMMNFIEDPRNDNFVSESYPTYRKNIDAAWSSFFEEAKQKTEAQAVDRLGVKPRFIQAGYEYIRRWFDEIQGRTTEIDDDLSDEVKAVVAATLEAARDSWWRYPSRQEADKSEELIKNYARVSYEINRDKIWPQFKTLVEADVEDQKTQELLKDMQRERANGQGGEQSLPQDLKNELTPEEQRALEEAIDKPSGKPIVFDSLPEGLKQKIKEYIDSLPEDQRKAIAEKAQAAFKEFEEKLNEEMQGRMSDDPERKDEREKIAESEKKAGERGAQGGEPVRVGKLREAPLDTEGLRIYKERLLREVNKDENVYEEYRREVLPLINQLESELRQLFVERKVTAWKGGFKTGKRIDIKKRIQEKARRTPAMESEAWQKRERPEEKDYAVSLLNDLSGSMRGQTMQEDFKAKIVFAEVLNKLGMNVEILGFNDEVYEYQKFGEPMSKQIREHMGGMFKEVDDSCCKACGNEHNETDLGWAVKTAAERLAGQKAAKKLFIVLTDGKLAESSKHPSDQYDPKKIKQEILDQTDIVPIDPGSITGQSVQEIVDRLKELIKQSL
jgi:hypothetical protein